MHFDPDPRFTEVSHSDLRDCIDDAIAQIQGLIAPEGKGETLGLIKQAAVSALQEVRADVPANGVAGKAEIDRVINALTTQANEEWQQALLQHIITSFRVLADRVASAESLVAAMDWVAQNLPRFI